MSAKAYLTIGLSVPIRTIPTMSVTPGGSGANVGAGKVKCSTRDRWSKEQTDSLVNAWKEFNSKLGSLTKASEWLKIKEKVNSAIPSKEMKQIKTKIKNLKDMYKKFAKGNNRRSGPKSSPYLF